MLGRPIQQFTVEILVEQLIRCVSAIIYCYTYVERLKLSRIFFLKLSHFHRQVADSDQHTACIGIYITDEMPD